MWDSALGMFDSYNTTGGAVEPEGFYYFNQTHDIGAVYSCRVTSYLYAFNASLSEFFDDAIGVWDGRSGTFDGIQNLDDANVSLQISTSNDNIKFTPWQNFRVGDYTARYFKFRLRFISKKTNVNMFVQNLRVTIDMPDKLQSKTEVSTATGTLRVTFPEPFYAIPGGVDLTIQNIASGDRWVISGLDKTGFNIVFFNSASTQVVRTFTYFVEAY
jgi:hypothetical protein